jgi:hypothetical protein
MITEVGHEELKSPLDQLVTEASVVVAITKYSIV